MEAIIKLLMFYMLIAKPIHGCTFPNRYKGKYLTQATPNFQDDVSSMSEVLISEHEIKPWGQCYGVYSSQYIINKRTGNKDCFRCFNLILRSIFVLQATTETMDYCYTDYNSANISCHTRDLYGTQLQDIFLYRKNQAEISDDASILCPIIGRYKMNYSSDGRRYRCNDYTSIMDNCPDGGYLSLKFRRCNFADYDLTYKCIGHWQSPKSQHYVALMEVGSKQSDVGRNFRCGIYQRDSNNVYIHLSLSASSSCTDQLYSSAIGYETMIFLQEEQKTLSKKDIFCRFPSWSLGKWQEFNVNPQSLFYEDGVQTIISYCIGNSSNSHLGIYLIRTVDQCGKEMYKCIWMVRRTLNVIEYQLGRNSSNLPLSSLCTLNQFDHKWKTKARIQSERQSACPLFGEYRGTIPNTDKVCAHLTNKCNQTEIIRYQINNCANPEQVYEDQEYRCHGSWEDDGFIYTYTTRKDSRESQCFVGRISKYGKEIVIADLGDNCYRRKQPLEKGMKMFRQVSCQRKTNASRATFAINLTYWQKIAMVLLLMCFHTEIGESGEFLFIR